MASLPSQPGVYWFLDANAKILYVGKAKNLKNRVKSYTQINQLTSQKQELVKTATQLKFEILTSEVEALLIEAELIRLHQPAFNVLLKDDKSPLYVRFAPGPFSGVELVRKRDVIRYHLDGVILGPYQSAYKLKQVLKIARKLFPWCDQAQKKINLVKSNQDSAQAQLSQNHQACFYHHLDLCPGACIGQINETEYQANLKQLILFLRGQKKEVVRHLKTKMLQAARELEFEQAAKLKQKIELIETVTSQQYRLKPDLILPALHEQKNKNALDHLRKILIEVTHLPNLTQLNRIEGYDVSNIMGQNAAVSMVCFTQGLTDKTNYRLFNIKTLNTPNDYGMLQEALRRRQNHREWGTPDLIVIDGGKGQVRSALSVWHWACPIIGLVKHPDRLVIPIKIKRDKKTNRLEIEYQFITLPSDHPTLHLVEQIRDESHRFAKKQHIRLRRKKLIS